MKFIIGQSIKGSVEHKTKLSATIVGFALLWP